jgi:hypothetical protein
MSQQPDPGEVPEEDLRRLRAWLASHTVEPLDEVTGRRLVRTALAVADRPDEVEPPGAAPAAHRPGRWLRAVGSAAAVLVLVLGVGVVVARIGEGPSEPSLGGLDDREVAASWHGHLGVIDTGDLTRGVEDLAARLPPAPPPGGLVRCVASVADARPLIATGAFTVAGTGEEAFAVEVDGGDLGEQVVLVVAEADCRLLARVRVD